MKVLVARHAGIGDLVMAVPIMGTLIRHGHEVTLQTHQDFFPWLRFVMPELGLEPCEVNPYTDFRWTHPRFDRFLNFNRVEVQDDLACDLRCDPVNQQYLYATLARMMDLPTPKDLSPSEYFPKPPVGRRTGPPLVFTKSSHPTRSLGPQTKAMLAEACPDAIFDPVFASRVELIQAICRARCVVGSDSGCIHLAELTHTPWTCLQTTMSGQTRTAFYKYGRSIQSQRATSPCYRHGGCQECQGACADEFNPTRIREAFTHGQ